MAGAALLVIVLLAAAVFAWMRVDGMQTRETTRSVRPVARTIDTAAGQNGGVVLTSGPFAAEILLSGKAGNARLVVYPFLEGKLATQNVSITGSLQRHDGTREALRFIASAPGFTSAQPIAQPHVFDAVIDVAVEGRSASFKFSRADGAIPLSVAQMQASGIEVARAGPTQIVKTVRLPGEIRLNEDRTAHVVPRVAGVIERVDVSIGQNVAQGQRLAIVASPELADRRSEWLAAQRRLEAARTAYRREKSLWQERISAEQDYLQAQTQLREAEIAAQNAGQKLAALNAPAASGALNRYELRAPFAGTIVAKHVAPGESVAADANLFTLSDLSTVWAEMAVPAQHLNDVRVGRNATVSTSAFESTAHGAISFVGALLGEQTRTAPARVVLPNPGGTWRPGLFVEVSVVAGARDVPVAVSTEALYDIDGASAVFVLAQQGFVAQPVQTGRRDAQSVEIVAGLRAGQRYAAQNAYVLKAELQKGSADEH
ncbi:efflux RND transporter periplasmic adaptor subunit [Paraburkholderia jirisanensis]